MQRAPQGHLIDNFITGHRQWFQDKTQPHKLKMSTQTQKEEEDNILAFQSSAKSLRSPVDTPKSWVNAKESTEDSNFVPLQNAAAGPLANKMTLFDKNSFSKLGTLKRQHLAKYDRLLARDKHRCKTCLLFKCQMVYLLAAVVEARNTKGTQCRLTQVMIRTRTWLH